MPRFLIEVPHDATKQDCVRAVEVFLRTGSHYLTHADWGCKDGDHKSWITVDVASKDEARNIVPPVYRTVAKIVQLNGFSVQDLENMLGTHGK